MRPTLVCLTLMSVLVALGGVSNAVLADAKAKDDAVRAVVDLLRECPAWVSIDVGDPDQTAQLDRCLAKVCVYPLDTIRSGIQDMLESDSARADLQLYAQSRVFLLNKYLFDVPVWIDIADVRVSGGWGGIPVKDGKMNLLWPFDKRENGELKLTGRWTRYYGPGYRPLEEFDYYRSAFPLRPHPAKRR